VKKAIEVSIMGQKFMVRSESDEDYVSRVAGYVDGKVNEVLTNTKSVASVQVALLTAMNIADEFFKYRQVKGDNLNKIEKKVQDMIELIDLQI
jgi:cell division protein ZapA